MKNLLRVLLLTALLAPVTAWAQGNITGKVTDGKTKETLMGVAVVLDSTTLGAMTDVDGNYTISNIPEGKYNVVFRYVGYANTTLKDIRVKNGETVKLEPQMGTEDIAIKQVMVTQQKIHNTENSVVAEMKNANNVVSGISSAQIQKSQDRNAAEVVKRIPGVTIIDGRFINIRGLSDRYNSTWINDANAPSTEVDRRAFSFDAIPAGMIERILVYKTPSPELPGDFAGGMVKIYTQSIPEKNSISGGYSVCFREGTTFKPFNTTEGSATDALGFDNGFRSIPAIAPNPVSKIDPSISDINKAFNNSWGIHNNKAIPDQRANLTLQGVLKKEKFTLGSTTALSYSLVHTNYTRQWADYDSLNQTQSVTDTVSSRTVNVGIMENIAIRFGGNQIVFKNLLNQTGIEQTTMQGNYFKGANTRYYGEYYQARTTLLSQLAGTHKFNEDKTEYEWNLSYIFGKRNEPDFRRIQYNYDDFDSTYRAQITGQVDPSYGGGRFYSKLAENTISFNHIFKQHISVGKGNYEFDISAGNYLEYKSREFDARLLGYTIKQGPDALQLRGLPLATIFDPTNIGESTKFLLDENVDSSNNYKALNEQIATFISFSLPIGTRVKLITGVRNEYNRQVLHSNNTTGDVNPSVVTNYFLPSMNLSVNITKKLLVRGAYGETINRPEFREWSPFHFYDFDSRSLNYGSLYPNLFFPNGGVLQVAEIHNVDMRFEWYPESGDLLHAGGFFKYFNDPIQKVISGGGGDSKAFTYINGDHAYVYGLELDMRKNLGFLDRGHSKSVLNSLSVVFNAALIKSKLYLPKVNNLVATTQLQGQSPNVFNAGIFYQNDSLGLQVSVLYNVFGPRVYAIGSQDYGNIGEMAKNTLDLTISKSFFKNRFTILFAIQDLINQANRLVLDVDRNNKFQDGGPDKNILNYKNGRYFTIGLKFKI